MEKSELWHDITDEFFRDITDKDLEDFRRPDSINSRLASWNPAEKTARHFKFLLWNVLEHVDDAFFVYLKNIRNRALGKPTSVHYHGLDIDIDYMLSADELVFLEKENNGLSRITSIVEVGGGFGRTAHAIIENFPNIQKYTIIDLPEVLELSKLYLQKVAPDKFSCFEFVNAFDEYEIEKTDLFINIDSFQEMTPETIQEYFERVISRCAAVYIKNPVGKYRPEEFLIPAGDNTKKPMSLGLCQDVYTICNEDEHAQKVQAYLKNYGFDVLEVTASRRCALFHYYHHALYTNPEVS